MYYILGGSNQQFAVYNGIQTAAPVIRTTTGTFLANPGRNVYIYPVEFNAYGTGSNVNLTYKATSTGSWAKEYNRDHLGDIRTVVKEDGTVGGQYDYEPFGAKLTVTDCKNRLTFIGKENDKESALGDFGVRKYDDDIGRFTSIDPLWEKYYGWTPYHYCQNSPLIQIDPEGDAGQLVAGGLGGLYILGGVGIALTGWAYTELTHPETNQTLGNSIKTAFNNSVQNLKDFGALLDSHNSVDLSSQNIPNRTFASDATNVKTPEPSAENTNPYKGPVTKPVNVADPAGNIIPVKTGEQIQSSPDGTFQQVKDANGKATGVRKDGPHGPNAPPEEKVPHGHRPDVPGTTHSVPINVKSIMPTK